MSKQSITPVAAEQSLPYEAAAIAQGVGLQEVYAIWE
jgi:hypothetical protein